MTDTVNPNECGQCIRERVAQTGAPEQLVTLPRRLAKTKKAVKVCPYCDGPLLLKIALNQEYT